MADKITQSNLQEFKKLVRKAIFLEKDKEHYFNSIPDDKWRAIFEKNFGGNWNYAQRVILNKFREIDAIDTVRVDKEKFKIHNLDRATQFVIDAIDDKSPILFITDFDNDGSLAQSIINEYLKIDITGAENMQVHYAQSINGNSNRGFTVDLVDHIIEKKGLNPDEKFLIITADNGINSKEEQLKIQAKYPLAEIVVTDHHNPDKDMVIEENDKVVIFNPHYKPTDFYKKFNISGATTVGVLLRNVLKERYTNEELKKSQNHLDNIAKLSKVANLLDYVDTDPADKPEKDYIITKFLKLQPLLNINNSISKIITGEISAVTIKSIQEKIPNLNTQLLYDEAKNIHIQNKMAKVLLKIYADNLKEEEILLEKQIEAEKNGELLNTVKRDSNYLNLQLLKELNEPINYLEESVINPNYIEQLRPYIFGLSADDTKSNFMSALNDSMIGVFESIKSSEKKMAVELRRGEVITKTKLDNSVIAYTDKNILTVFNRKFLNKVYNDENPGFSLTLDSIDKGKVSGSFRSLYDISDILKDKTKLERMLKIKIETPGHQRAAGFILKSLQPEKNPITKEVIEAVNIFINNSITKIKEKEIAAESTYLLTDLGAITLIDSINQVVRGNVSNFEKINTLLKLTKDSIVTDSYTTQQFSMEEIIRDRKYGYITIDISFHKDTVIIPVELIRRIVENDYKDYLSLGYMDGGVFMAEKVVKHENVNKLIDLRDQDNKSLEIAKVFEKDFKDKNYVNLTRDQIQDNPFFKYHDYGRLNFDLFEKMVIGIIDTNNIDMLSVFDVEANGFANSKLMNLGAMNYYINPNSGITLPDTEFNDSLYATQRGDEYLLTKEQIAQLKEISVEEMNELPVAIKKLLLVKPLTQYDLDKLADIGSEINDFTEKSQDNLLISEENIVIDTPQIGNHYYYHPSMEEMVKNNKIKSLPFLPIKNYLFDNTYETVTYNREIEATMLAYLVNDEDFKVPQVMTNLTGITQEILRKYGKPTHVVDFDFAKFYKGKKVLFGAHNTPYDGRVMRANTPLIYDVLMSNDRYDSALFSREKKLAYDEVKVANFENIDGLSKAIYFYNNDYSDFNIRKFITENKNGYFPDRTGHYLLSIENNEYFLVDKKAHEIIKINVTQEELILSMRTGDIPNTSVKYSVEKLSEQWMIHSLLLSDEKFDIQHVDLNNDHYEILKSFKDILVFFQDNYHFDSSAIKNIENLSTYYRNVNGKDLDLDEDQQVLFIEQFLPEFLEKNKSIQQKFADAWMYKTVLSIKEPSNNDDITNDLVDLVQFQTTLPREKIVNIYKEAIAFKKKYKIDHIIQHEGHINGPWEFDNKGDVAFEDKLTLSLLAQRHYDPYNHSVRSAVREFNQYKLRAIEAFEKADKLSEEVAQDSYSFRQGILYERENKTNMINAIQEKEKKLTQSTEESIVVFKLNNDILPPDTNVCAVTKEGILISREQLEKDSKMLSFILANEQIRYALEQKGSVAQEYATEVLKANDAISKEYKENLSERYRFVEYNRKIHQIKKLLDIVINIAQNNSYKETKSTRELPIDNIGKQGFEIIKSVFYKYVEAANNTVDTRLKPEGVNLAKEFLAKKMEDYPPTSLENAIDNKDIHFAGFSEVKEAAFLDKVIISRQNPIKNLINDHSDLRLLNQFIDNNIQLMLEEPIVKKKSSFKM